MSDCPNCGSHVTFTVRLAHQVAGGYRPDHFGHTPEHGDTITRCDTCGTFWTERKSPPPPASSTSTRRPARKRAPATSSPKRTAKKRATTKRAASSKRKGVRG